MDLFTLTADLTRLDAAEQLAQYLTSARIVRVGHELLDGRPKPHRLTGRVVNFGLLQSLLAAAAEEHLSISSFTLTSAAR